MKIIINALTLIASLYGVLVYSILLVILYISVVPLLIFNLIPEKYKLKDENKWRIVSKTQNLLGKLSRKI